MDMTKAFDLVCHSLLFKKLLERGLPPIFIRMLLFMYTFQVANVRWGGKYSMNFSVANGVKQGAVLSAILYCLYTDGLFQLLRKKKIGCWIQGVFCGVLGYADDIMALCPSREGLQQMMSTCEEYAREHNLQFSTHIDPKKSKTKCLAFLKKNRELKKIVLNGDCLPWWDSGKHIGNTIENNLNGMKKDIGIKRASYVQRNCEINQEFFFSNPMTRIHLNKIYNFSFNGSPLWDLFGDSSETMEKTYNISVRTMLKLHRDTHCYLIEPLTREPHLKFVLIKRFLQFKQQAMKCNKVIMKKLFQIFKFDSRSITGSNYRKIMLLCNKNSIEDIDCSDIDALSYRKCPESEEWRISLINELSDARMNPAEVLPGFSSEEIEDLLNFACIS